ncbi:MAG: N-acyl homoserine lactonase family protein [Thermoleophilaceae bacterium]|nr:N-acyl homoserine lactonase family protein [Thermoleophilaceae bacterium]
MRVELFNVGWITAPAGFWRRGDEDPGRPVRLPVPAYLIETDMERILVDTGLHPAAVADKNKFYSESAAMGYFELEQHASIADQLDVASITKIILTHLHFDHVGGLALFPASVPVVVQRAEWEAGQNPVDIGRNFYFPRDYAAPEREVILIDGDHDLLGDGSIELLFTPGHTPGHQSVRVGNLVLGADVVHFADGLDDHHFPAIAHDDALQAQSANRLRKLREAGFAIQPGHDPDVLRPGAVAI